MKEEEGVVFKYYKSDIIYVGWIQMDKEADIVSIIRRFSVEICYMSVIHTAAKLPWEQIYS